MSDNPDESAQDEPDSAPGVECAIKILNAAKVRAVIIDGETYLNGPDLVRVMKARAILETQELGAMTKNAPRELIPVLMAASQNCIAGMALMAKTLRVITRLPILPLSNEEGLLVDPGEMTDVPDTVPTAWIREE
jgi:hypothetical protein